MVAPKMKKKMLGEFSVFFEWLLTQKPTSQVHNSLDFFRPSERLLENPKTGFQGIISAWKKF